MDDLSLGEILLIECRYFIELSKSQRDKLKDAYSMFDNIKRFSNCFNLLWYELIWNIIEDFYHVDWCLDKYYEILKNEFDDNYLISSNYRIKCNKIKDKILNNELNKVYEGHTLIYFIELFYNFTEIQQNELLNLVEKYEDESDYNVYANAIKEKWNSCISELIKS